MLCRSRGALAPLRPQGLPALVPSLWRRDHTHGALTFDVADRAATVRLVDHPYADDDFGARVFADTLRGLFLLARATRGQVRERHARVPPRTLVVELSWGLPSSKPPEMR